MSFQPVLPPRVEPRLRSAPRIRQIHWCDFPKDAQLPEMWKRRPVVILSKAAHYYGTVTILPLTSADQSGNPAAFRLDPSVTGEECWVLCDKITTVAVSRLVPNKGGEMRMPHEVFNRMLARVLDQLPKVLPMDDLDDEPLTSPSP